MKNELVKIHDGEPRASSWILKDGFGFEDDHRYVVRMIEKYKTDFEEFGVVTTERQKPAGKKGGRPVQPYLLNENQTMFLGTLFRNTPEVIRFKKKLIKQFDKQKKVLAAIASLPQNAEWLETRNTGKAKRLVETDTIQKFVQYATDQGSQNAKMYYSNISKMQNKALFFFEHTFKNIRDVLNLQQLSIVVCADEIVTKALHDGMASELNYKDIYKLAKKRIESFADIHGKTLIPGQPKQLTGGKDDN